MLNIVHDNLPYSNVWFNKKKEFDLEFSYRHDKPIPNFFHFVDDIVFHTSADGLDNFIYPIVMHEPFIEVRSLIMNESSQGFWSHVCDSVIQGLREKRGWIIIDIFSEPVNQFDFDQVISALSDSSQFPNDRILLNTASPHFTKNKRVFNFSTYLEAGCLSYHLFGSQPPCLCKRSRATPIKYPHKRFLLLNSHIDYPIAVLFAKYAAKNADYFLDSSHDVYKDTSYDLSPKHLQLPEALLAADLNVVLEAYLNDDVVNYTFITEKTYRNIHYKKPFIIMGQHHSLATLHKLGYKTFSTLIDESYDNLTDTKERCKAVIKELEKLKAMSRSEWSNLIENCKPIVEHNYNNLLKRITQSNDWLEGLKDL